MSDGSAYGPFIVASGQKGDKGDKGDTGGQGPQGNQGDMGYDSPQGPMGEVSAGQLDMAISTTSANTNAVEQLGMTVSGPPTQSEMQTIANKLDELIAALRR